MILSRSGLVAVSLAALVASGCTSTRFGSEDSQPAPLEPQPSGTVSSSQLPPPAAPAPTDASKFPTAPGAGTQVASLPAGGGGNPPPNAPDLTASAIAGVWSASVAGQGCKVATPQTKFGQGFRAGPLRCPPPIDNVKSWNVAGKQLTLYDQDGGTLARLYSSSPTKFDGQTSNGQPISLSR